MKLDQREEGGVVILELSGDIMGGPDAALLNDKLHELLDADKRKIVADLEKVTWMNAAGLGILIGGLTTTRNSGGDLKLANMTDRIQSLLLITKLLTIFESHETVDDAIESYN